MIEATKQCEGQVVDKFPLRQYLGETEKSTVFLTDRDKGQKAAIKFVPADGAEATKQLEHWKRAAQISHPHLLKIFETGQCQLGGRNHVYAVMEYAEENLSEILPQRALTPAETREMVVPMLDCLAFLHGKGFVLGHLRPGNIMASNNQLKLASDGIRQAGEAYGSGKRMTRYDPPESGTATLSASSDVWSLGLTLVEVLTQRLPDWETRNGEPLLPASVPEPFREIARHCLQKDPNARWTIPQIQARLNPPPARIQQAPLVQPERRPVNTKSRGSRFPLLVAGALVLAIIAAFALFRHGGKPGTAERQVAPPKAEQMAAMGTKPDAGLAASQNGAGQGTQGEILRQVPPKISPGAQKTIRGKIKIRVRVHVNTSGDVTRADLVTAGPSRYFARVVGDAAKQWKFAPSSSAERRWMLQFDLTRGGTVVHPQKVS